jgi:DNA-binding NarL/FixJ family response regulator
MELMNVLIAEDHKLSAKLLEKILETAQGIKVVGIAENGLQVFDFIEREAVDLILMDLMMPLMDGLQALNQIMKINPYIKVIILSACDNAQIIQKAIDSGASGYLTKSISVDEIVHAITAVYRGNTYFSKDTLENLINAV